MSSRIPYAPSFFQSATRLSALTYRASDIDPFHVPPEAKALRSLTIQAFSCLDREPDPRSQRWDHVLRDIAMLSHPNLENLSIVLWLHEQNSPPVYGPLAEDEPFYMLVYLLVAPDWTPLNRVMQKCPRLRKLSIGIALWERRYKNELLAREPLWTREVVWEVAKARLEAEIRDILDVRFNPHPKHSDDW